MRFPVVRPWAHKLWYGAEFMVSGSLSVSFLVYSHALSHHRIHDDFCTLRILCEGLPSLPLWVNAGETLGYAGPVFICIDECPQEALVETFLTSTIVHKQEAIAALIIKGWYLFSRDVSGPHV